MKKLLLSFTLSSYLFASEVVVPDKYFISDDTKSSYIYPNEYKMLIPKWKAYQSEIVKGYEAQFDFKLDSKLYVGMASNKNQIANGFSTQFPFNSQLFYGAGAGYIDYFCFSSWLKTLIIHETAHNFQLNPKENIASELSHKILGNSFFSFLGPFPLFPVPNITESSFLFEGNAVMNESRYGNGGRLFSGYALAELVALAKAGKITPELMYNPTLFFPYSESFYLVGGFFQQFLVKRYGLKRVNSYFKTYSTQLLPLFSNSIFKKQYGKDFKVLLAEFVEEILEEHKGFIVTKGELIAMSQSFTSFNRDEDEIYTLIGDRRSAYRIFRVDKKSKEVSFKVGNWRGGEVFKHEGVYYTQASAKTSPTQIEMGLFDKESYLLEGTASKAVQGYKRNGEMVYMDVLSSIERPQIYVGDKFYSEAYSSVYVEGNDLYYFKQEGEKRVLYKNKKVLYAYDGHYGFVAEVDKEGRVYFIASSKSGSTVYALEKGALFRVTKGDDVIEFKLLNKKEALVGTVGAEGYAYKLLTLEKHKVAENRPFKMNIKNSALGNSTLETRTLISSAEPLKSKVYTPLTQLHYSSLAQEMSYASYTGVNINLQANFSDPLTQNSLSTIISHNRRRTVGGLSYGNSAYPLKFGGALYGVKKDDFTNDMREYGADAYLHLPFLATGYWRGLSSLAYTKDYKTLTREPVTFSLNVTNKKQFGVSKYPNELNSLSLFLSSDRENLMYGGAYSWMNDLPWQSYVGLKATYLKSDEVNSAEEKGIELSDTFSSLQSEKATVNIPTFTDTSYAKELKMAEVSFSKVFDFSSYNYSLPLSLQRESIYVKQRLYDVDFTDTIHRQYNETVVGLEADLLFFHKGSVPFAVEYLYNADVKDKHQIEAVFRGEF